jgi:glucose-6-phosphate isomerase
MDKLTEGKAWKNLQRLSKQFKQKDFRLTEMFNDENRFDSFSITHEELLLDFSKNLISPAGLNALIELAEERQLSTAISAMFAGEKINYSEERAALHTALRIPEKENPHVEIVDCLQKMEAMVNSIHSGARKGHSGKPITDIVNIGIGGSDLGPSMVCDALLEFATNDVNLHFVSNVDPAHLNRRLKDLSPDTTLFVVASKSFTTLETLQNAQAAKTWLQTSTRSTEGLGNHFIAISSNIAAAKEFGLEEANILPMWDWVGGRFSLWSAIGLPIALLIGMKKFRELLAGAHSMDAHFQSAKLHENVPVLMALLSVWYRGFFDCHSSAIVPYSQYLQQFPAYAQQLYMESLGKSVDVHNQALRTNSAEILWGTAGTSGQHSYFQLLHQGTEFVPIDFVAFINCLSEDLNGIKRHQHLLANCLSQSLALMTGNSASDDASRNVPGNKPSNTILVKQLNPYNLGSLIALYEHKTFVQSVIWNINAFDQWGVELGKQLSNEIFNSLQADTEVEGFDQSTAALIAAVRAEQTE